MQLTFKYPQCIHSSWKGWWIYESYIIVLFKLRNFSVTSVTYLPDPFIIQTKLTAVKWQKIVVKWIIQSLAWWQYLQTFARKLQSFNFLGQRTKLGKLSKRLLSMCSNFKKRLTTCFVFLWGTLNWLDDVPATARRILLRKWVLPYTAPPLMCKCRYFKRMTVGVISVTSIKEGGDDY
jgi:hypothetical protein